MISREKRKEYIKAAGSFCINCGSGNISAGKVESEGREAWQPVQCYDCGSEWNDIFRLIGVDDIILPEDGPVMPVVFGKKAPMSTPRRIQEMKPVKTEGNFVDYKEGARRAAFSMQSDARLFEGCNRLLAAAKRVVENWKHGDLAAAAHYPSTMNPAFQEGFAPKGAPFRLERLKPERWCNHWGRVR